MTCVYCSVNLFYNAQAVQSLYPAVVDGPVGEVDEDPPGGGCYVLLVHMFIICIIWWCPNFGEL